MKNQIQKREQRMKEKFAQLDNIIRDHLRKNKIPGLAISIFKEDQIVYSKGFGARDLEEFLPMTPQTLIGIGRAKYLYISCFCNY
ncbi:MAG: serine hydrolase [Promethearchaeota archaeon]|nr:MAG: serine hydrolase [Candidatus Lokiarchaeota archaeon]